MEKINILDSKIGKRKGLLKLLTQARYNLVAKRKNLLNSIDEDSKGTPSKEQVNNEIITNKRELILLGFISSILLSGTDLFSEPLYGWFSAGITSIGILHCIITNVSLKKKLVSVIKLEDNTKECATITNKINHTKVKIDELIIERNKLIAGKSSTILVTEYCKIPQDTKRPKIKQIINKSILR